MATKKARAAGRGTSAASRSTVTKLPATKAPAKRTTAKKAAPKKAAKKATAKKAAPAKAARASATTKRSAPSKKPRVGRSRTFVVRADEKPWTTKELAEVGGELESDRDRLQQEITSVEQGLQDLLRDAGDGAGNDQADVGSTTLERDAEMSLANNTRDMLFQVQRALGRLDDGTYGVCESCGNPIGKLRLMAFPRATLCLTCKQREERR